MSPSGWLDLRRWSLALTLLGGVLLAAAAWLLVSHSFGRLGMTATDELGRTVMFEVPTPSVMQSSPSTAYGWIAASVGVAVVLGLALRYGGYVGPVVVILLMWLAVMASILTIGIYLAPGAGLMSSAAAAALAHRAAAAQRRSEDARLSA